MYAIVKIGGHQYKVSENDAVYVNRLPNQTDETIALDNVLLLKNDKGEISVGKPYVEGVTVSATVKDHLKADKVIVFKKKRRKGYRVKNGHRQAITRLHIEKIG